MSLMFEGMVFPNDDGSSSCSVTVVSVEKWEKSGCIVVVVSGVVRQTTKSKSKTFPVSVILPGSYSHEPSYVSCI